MKKLVLSILFIVLASSSSAYTPIIYINGQPYNAGVPYGITALQNHMDHKPEAFAPSFQLVSSTVFSHQADNLDYNAWLLALTYHQKLDGLLQGLFFQAIAPITIAANHSCFNIATTVSQSSDLSVYVQNGGIADPRLLLGYKFLDLQNHQATLNFDVIFPSLQDKDANLPVIPTLGNGGHLALGASFNGTTRLAGCDKHGVTLTGELQLHKLLQTNKQPLLGLVGQSTTLHSPNDRFEAVTRGDIVKQDVIISSTQAFDAAASITYNYDVFFVNVESAYHFKGKRSLSAMDANPDLLIFNKFINQFRLNGTRVNLESIDLQNKSAIIPASHLLTIGSNIGFAMQESSCPITKIQYAFNFSIGGNATIAHTNNASVWDFNIKSGFAF